MVITPVPTNRRNRYRRATLAWRTCRSSSAATSASHPRNSSVQRPAAASHTRRTAISRPSRPSQAKLQAEEGSCSLTTTVCRSKRSGRTSRRGSGQLQTRRTTLRTKRWRRSCGSWTLASASENWLAKTVTEGTSISCSGSNRSLLNRANEAYHSRGKARTSWSRSLNSWERRETWKSFKCPTLSCSRLISTWK